MIDKKKIVWYLPISDRIKLFKVSRQYPEVKTLINDVDDRSRKLKSTINELLWWGFFATLRLAAKINRLMSNVQPK